MILGNNWRQHSGSMQNTSGKAVALRTILLCVGGTCYTEHTLNQLKQLGLDHQRAIKLACKLHALPGAYANKLVATRCVIGILCFVASWWRGLMALLSQCVSYSLIEVGRVSSAYAGRPKVQCCHNLDDFKDARAPMQDWRDDLYWCPTFWKFKAAILLQPGQRATPNECELAFCGGANGSK
eukprot:1154959-Pelagomonas_calceolata.AAC.4